MAHSPATPQDPTRGAIARLHDAERGRSRRFAWALLGSVWVHIGVASLVLVGTRCGPTGDAAQARSVPMTVMLVQAADSRQDSSEAPPARDVDPLGGTSTEAPTDAGSSLEQASWAELDPQALASIDLASLKDIDPALIEALPAEVLATLSPQQLAQLDAALLQQLADKLPAADPARSAVMDALASRTPAGMAQAPEQATPDPRPSPGAPDEREAPESPGADPDDAVADLALPERADPVRSPEDPVDRPEPDDDDDEPEQPEPEPEPTEDPRWKRYLHADATAPVEEAASDAFISSRSSRAEDLRRVEVTSEVEGFRTPPLDGLPIEAGTPSMDLADGDPEADGGDAPAAGEPVEQRIAVEQGGGDDGDADGLGSPKRGEGQRGGAPARSGRRAAASASAVLVTGGDAPTPGVPDAPQPDDLQPRRRDASWSPVVARVLVHAPDIEPAEAPITAAMITEQVDRAPEPRPDDADDRGGTEQPVDVDEPLPDAPEDTPTPEEGEPEPTEEPEPVDEPIESVADLRSSLGWGGRDQARTRPRRSMPGVATTDGNLRTSQQTASTELMVDRMALVDAVDSPLGRYRAQIDEVVSKQWNTYDLSLHERALGIQGDVSVVFHVQSNGKVSDKTITRSSGYTSLDAMAVDAIPDKLPHFPKDIEASSLFHAYTFVYRNPMIVGGDTP